MRRSDHPSRPSAMTCCFFASFKTFPTGGGYRPHARVNVLVSGLPLAGFEVATYGRFWVAPEDYIRFRRGHAAHPRLRVGNAGRLDNAVPSLPSHYKSFLATMDGSVP